MDEVGGQSLGCDVSGCGADGHYDTVVMNEATRRSLDTTWLFWVEMAAGTQHGIDEIAGRLQGHDVDVQ
jgi:hypothetical protein